MHYYELALKIMHQGVMQDQSVPEEIKKDGIFLADAHKEKLKLAMPISFDLPLIDIDAAEEIKAWDQKPLELPFQTCFFEVFDGVFNWQVKDQFVVTGFFIHELAPLQYELLMLMGNPRAPGQVMFFLPRHVLAVNQCMAVIAMLCKKFKKDEIGYTNVRKSVKIAKHETHRINKVIFVTPKKHKSALIAKAPLEINWTHRWQVRGHWRAIKADFFGKDREGKAQKNGYTWVHDFVKGPKEAPLVKKGRIVL